MACTELGKLSCYLVAHAPGLLQRGQLKLLLPRCALCEAEALLSPGPRQALSRVPFGSPGLPEGPILGGSKGPSHQTAVSAFLTLPLPRCCRVRFFSLGYLRGRMRCNDLCKLSTQTAAGWAKGNENFPKAGKFNIF